MNTSNLLGRRPVIGAAAFLFAGLGAVPALAQGTPAPAAPVAAAGKVTLYKDPNCGCCQGYADFLAANGFEVEVNPTFDLARITADAGIPEEFAGCHTFFIGDYAFGGHVPLATLTRFLTERPGMIGLTVPGMPMGSPGMGGEKMEPLTVYAVVEGSAPTVYAVE